MHQPCPVQRYRHPVVGSAPGTTETVNGNALPASAPKQKYPDAKVTETEKIIQDRAR